MKKALIVATVAGFVASFEYNDIQLLKSKGYEVHCAFKVTPGGNEEKKKVVYDNTIVHPINFSRRPLSASNIRSYKQLKSLMKKEHFDFVHCHTPVGGVLGRLAAHRCKVPVIIYTAHGFHFYSGAPVWNWLLYYPAEWLCSWWTDILITINKEDYKLAKNKFHAYKTVYVPGVGIDMAKFRPDAIEGNKKRIELGVQDEEIMILSVGELSARKNHEVVIRALHELRNPYVKYYICGAGELKPYLENLIQELGLTHQVSLLGFRTDVLELCQAADLFILPSHQEGVSVALMEAIACQVPVACSKIRGNEDLVKDHLFDEKNAQDLTCMLQEIATTRNGLHKTMEQSVHANYDNLRGFDLKHVLEKMKELYQV